MIIRELWRPILMLLFGFILFLNWGVMPFLGIEPVDFPLWFGAPIIVYIAGRSADKALEIIYTHSRSNDSAGNNRVGIEPV